MPKKLSTVRQAMELTIQHYLPADVDQGQAGVVWTLESYLDSLPAEFAAALRAEIAKGTLLVSLVPEGSRVGKPRARRPKTPAVS